MVTADTKVIKGPSAPADANSVIYQITLPGGLVLTNPCSFPSEGDDEPHAAIPLVVTEDGRIIGHREFTEASLIV